MIHPQSFARCPVDRKLGTGGGQAPRDGRAGGTDGVLLITWGRWTCTVDKARLFQASLGRPPSPLAPEPARRKIIVILQQASTCLNYSTGFVMPRKLIQSAGTRPRVVPGKD